MKPRRGLSRRSFVRSVCGVALGGGMMVATAGRAAAFQASDSDSGAKADPAGTGRGPSEPGDSDFANPRAMGDVIQSDAPPGRRTGLTDHDAGPAADLVDYGVGANRREVRLARCTATRQRIGRLEGERPRSAEIEQQIESLRPYLDRWACN